ncbi:MAG TPA: DUF1592 domain-containing protein [Polyangiaceae bacterium]|nr:DUF1592 domain-containing protein [Polyangiaceae bacterium]
MQHRHPLAAGVLLASLALGACVGHIGPSGSEAAGSSAAASGNSTADGGSKADGGAPSGAGAPAAGGAVSSGGTPASSGGAGGMSSAECAGTQVGPERIHRLTPAEYTNSLRALLNSDALDPVLDADREPIATLDAVRKWYNAADAAVPGTVTWLSAYGNCNPESDAACAKTLYEAFAERAFRRPLKEDERAWLAESWSKLPAAAPVALRLETITELILQAPQFLYVYAEGTPSGTVNVLDSYERAQRLSYFLWDSLPDAALLSAAKAGALMTSAGMRGQAERMLADERAKPVLRSFLVQWLELDGAAILPSLAETPKDSKLFPGFDAVLRTSMRREVEMFMDHVMFEKDGSLEELFSGTRAYVNAPLAKLYGVSGPASADTWAWVDLDPTQRAGMLTRAGFLAVHASQNVTSPIRRGVYLLKDVLCVALPAPPANVDNTPVEVTGGDVTTVRQATLKRTGSPSCAGCHVQINELGFAFEHYDAIGRWQEKEAGTGAAIDASAQLSNAGANLDGPVTGAIELSQRLAQSPAVAKCAARKWFEVALRRSPVSLDACSLQEIQEKTAETRSIRELLLAMVESDAFLNVNHGE